MLGRLGVVAGFVGSLGFLFVSFFLGLLFLFLLLLGLFLRAFAEGFLRALVAGLADIGSGADDAEGEPNDAAGRQSGGEQAGEEQAAVHGGERSG